jgi:hypothetical protein
MSHCGMSTRRRTTTRLTAIAAASLTHPFKAELLAYGCGSVADTDVRLEDMSEADIIIFVSKRW